ncbi:MAG: tetratricopeptide repeat protein [Planctomycetaceae bacterium]|jgi:tetratricopeptide (TPR) repeat protein|nr:tetratricopeptide repeat protein [Planctomycetaceae bacterium]
MAKRYIDEENENEDDEVVIRRRRRPVKKITQDDDDDETPNTRNKKKNAQNDDDDNEDESEDDLLPSTGFVLLDILLDYRDDYFEWGKKHFLPAVIIGMLGTILFFTPIVMAVVYVYNYINRPTLQKAIDAYDYGAYGEAGKFAKIILKYTSRRDDRTRAGALFVLGASTCSIAELSLPTPKKAHYLAAAKYLTDSRALGYYPGRQAEAAFLLGKSLFYAGEVVKAREPLLFALENNLPNRKSLYWFLANSYFLAPNTKTNEAIQFINLYKAEPTITDDEIFEAEILTTLVFIYQNNPEAAEQQLKKVPLFNKYDIMRNFIKGQIAFLQANKLRTKNINPNENSNQNSIQNNNSKNNTIKQILPQPITALTPVFDPSFEPEDQNSIYRRIIYIAQNETITPNNPTTPTPNPPTPNPPTSNPPTSDSPTDIASPFSNEPPESSSPDAVIILPPEVPAAPVNPPLTGSPFSETGAFGSGALPPDMSNFPALSNELLTSDPFSIGAKKNKELAYQKYLEAIEFFRLVRRNDWSELKWLRTAELLEGKCNEEINELAEAKERYQHLNEIFAGTDEAAAADFWFAEIERDAGRFENAIAIYNRAFDTLRKNPDYSCHWLTRDEIVEMSRTNLQNLIRRRNYIIGIAMLSTIRDVIPAQDIAKFRGEFYENWGRDLLEEAATKSTNDKDAGERITGYSEKFRRAGNAFAELARYQFGNNTYEKQIWRCAENFRLGKDHKHAIEAYKAYLRVNQDDRQAESLMHIGEMYINLGMIDDAIENLEEAVTQYPNDALISKIRLLLSHAYNEKHEIDKAKQLLITNLTEGNYDPSSLVYSDSVYLLAKMSYEQGKIDDAIVYIEDALKIRPDARQAAESHYFVARSYLTRADETLAMMKDAAPVREVQEQIKNSAATDRAEALKHIQIAENLLMRRRETNELTESETLMLKNTMFGAGKIMMQLGQYEKAIATFNMAATRYHEPASLDALMQIALASRILNKTDDAISTLNRAEMLLQQLEESGTIPKENNWLSKIQGQRTIINNNNTNNNTNNKENK